jgi:hypothetical protein
LTIYLHYETWIAEKETCPVNGALDSKLTVVVEIIVT